MLSTEKLFLRNVPFFSRQMDDEQLEKVAEVGHKESVEANTILFHEGDKGDSLYVILEGRVEIFIQKNGGRAILQICGAGEFFGEMALLDGRPRSATISTLEACTFFILNQDEFLGLLITYPELLSHMVKIISGKVRHSSGEFFRSEMAKQALHTETEIERHRSVAQMVAGVAHELNTPLGIANTAASIIKSGLTSDVISSLELSMEAEEELEDILEAANLMQANISRAHKLIQSFKSISVSQLTDTKEKLNLSELVNDIVGLFKINARQANLTIEIKDHLTEQTNSWLGYRGYLSRVLMNLLTNVVRYAYPAGEGGKVEIVIDADHESKEPSFILTVRDFGQGITPEHLSQVFDLFFTTGRTKGGSGMGLAIVHNLVTDALKGTINLESALGKGTTFTITFPQAIKEKTNG